MGGVFSRKDGSWAINASPEAAVQLHDLFLGQAIEFDDEFNTLLKSSPTTAIRPPINYDLEPVKITKTPPWPHQTHVFHMIANDSIAMVDHDMGTGKSKTIVDTVVNLDGCMRTLIVCPSTVVPVWPHEFEKHAGGPVTVLALGHGPIKKRAQDANRLLDRADADERIVLVINYEAFWREDFAVFALSRIWDIIVADESHRAKNPQTRTCKFLAQLGLQGRRRVCLTGTPMPHSPLDVFGQYLFLNRNIFGRYWTSFRARYAVMGGFTPAGATKPVQVLGYRNIKELNEKFYSIAHRVEKRDVLKHLPAVMHERRVTQLGAKTKKAYRELQRDLITYIGGAEVTATNVLSKMLRLQQLTSGFVPTDDQDAGCGELTRLDSCKGEALAEVLEDIPRTEPVVVFCRFRADLDSVAQHARTVGRGSCELSGRVKQLDDWRESVHRNVLAVQIQSGGVGIDLTHAWYCVFYSIGFSLGDYEQALARVDRQGQTKPVTYIHLMTENTIDEVVYEALRSRKNVVEYVRRFIVLKKGTR